MGYPSPVHGPAEPCIRAPSRPASARAGSRGAAERTVWIGPWGLVPMQVWMSSSAVSSMARMRAAPALFTRMSTRPNRSST